MSRKEVPRAGLLKAAVAAQISNAEVAGALHLSIRQVQRLKHRFRLEGATGLRHRGRGRLSRRRLAPDVRRRAAKLLQSRYRDVNDCHAAEKLQEVDGLPISRASVQRLRRVLGLPAKHQRRSRAYRARRVPAACMGALVQLDASPFEWLEGRGPAMSLHGAIDDASRTVVALFFRPTEDLHGYATLLHQLGTTYGLPLALYGDRLNVFVRNDRHWSLEEQLRGERDPTHFGQMLRELGIGYIAAGSPQAKGRIERLWRTLQDRLTVELRLRGIDTLAAANAFLPTFCADFNRRFARPPADATAVWRPAPRDFTARLSCRYSRTVGRDYVVRLGDRLVQLPRGSQRRAPAGSRVEVRECVDGRVLVSRDHTVLTVQPSPGPHFTLTPRYSPSQQRRARQRRPSRSAALNANGSHREPPSSPPPTPATAAAPLIARPPRRPAPTHPWRHTATYDRRAQKRTRARAGATFSLSS
jgi:transposase